MRDAFYSRYIYLPEETDLLAILAVECEIATPAVTPVRDESFKIYDPQSTVRVPVIRATVY